MTPEEFRRAGHELIDWIVEYRTTIESLPVSPPLKPGGISLRLEQRNQGRSWDTPAAFTDVMNEFREDIFDGITHWQSPNFFAYFPTNSLYGSIIGEIMTAGLAVNAMSWATSPAATELEMFMLDTMVDLLGLPSNFKGCGVTQDTASSSTLCAILAARHSTSQEISTLVGYTSDQSHSSVEKGLRVAGIRHVRAIPSDAAFAMDPTALKDQIERDIADGLTPFFVCATAGTTSSGAFDPVDAIADICEPHHIWVHLDAAMYGIAALVEDQRWVNRGIERVNSYVTNPHKWMGIQFDCSLLWVTNPDALTAALSIEPEYLRSTHKDAGSVIDYRDWQVQLGRRFRALKMWTTLRLEGVEAMRAMICHHVDMAQELAERIEESPYFQVVAPHPLSLVCFVHCTSDDATDAMIHRVNNSGAALLTRTVLNGRPVARVSIGNALTEPRHIDALWNRIESAADRAAHV